MDILLSKVTFPILNWICQLLGWLMNGIYLLFEGKGVVNIGLCIVIYTIVVYICMIPIQVSTLKNSKLLSFIQPEMSKIQRKYQGRRDQASQAAQSQEMMAVYSKYGISPYGSCLPLLIQMPLIIGLYQVIYHIPGYITRVKEMLSGVAESIMNVAGGQDYMLNFISENNIRVTLEKVDGVQTLTTDTTIDALYLLKPEQWNTIQSSDVFSSIAASFDQVKESLFQVNSFFGLTEINISETPWDLVKGAFTAERPMWIIIIGILVPLLAWFTQWFNMKVQPNQNMNSMSPDSPQMNMKLMTNFMPIFSAVMCFSFSLGIGIYWVAGGTIRTIETIIINRRMMKWNMDEILAKTSAKAKKKGKRNFLEKIISPQPEDVNPSAQSSLNSQARQKTLRAGGNTTSTQSFDSRANNNSNSLFAKAGMVDKYNDVHAEASKKNSGKKSKKK